jgi:hypothetical protein
MSESMRKPTKPKKPTKPSDPPRTRFLDDMVVKGAR